MKDLIFVNKMTVAYTYINQSILGLGFRKEKQRSDYNVVQRFELG